MSYSNSGIINEASVNLLLESPLFQPGGSYGQSCFQSLYFTVIFCKADIGTLSMHCSKHVP